MMLSVDTVLVETGHAIHAVVVRESSLLQGPILLGQYLVLVLLMVDRYVTFVGLLQRVVMVVCLRRHIPSLILLTLKRR